MTAQTLCVLGVGSYVPPAYPTRELAACAGAVTDDFHGWDNVCVAGDVEHPSTMGAESLRKALATAGVDASQLAIVLSCGMSRDYQPSWSVSTEIMKLCGASNDCLGVDLTVGCLGALAGLTTALGWLTTSGGRYGAVVLAERWSHTVDRSAVELMPLWAHADGAGAFVVATHDPGTAVARYVGSCFSSWSEYNGYVLVKYGGTRFPAAPPGHSPFARQLTGAKSDAIEVYRDGYTRAFGGLRARFRFEPSWLVCNQITPNMVEMLSGIAGVPAERTVVTGHQLGHLGPADVVLGLEAILRRGPLDGPVAMACSTPYAFGAGLLVEP